MTGKVVSTLRDDASTKSAGLWGLFADVVRLSVGVKGLFADVGSFFVFHFADEKRGMGFYCFCKRTIWAELPSPKHTTK